MEAPGANAKEEGRADDHTAEQLYGGHTLGIFWGPAQMGDSPPEDVPAHVSPPKSTPPQIT